MDILNFIYTDEINLVNIDNVIALMIEANKYNLTWLKMLCENYLAQIINQDNVNELLYLSDIHNANELWWICIDYCVRYFAIITKRRDFDKLSKQTMLEIVKKAN